ncbi:MAG: hypothetical protein ACRDGU_10145 [Actinomycetota bacterium]
MGTLRKFLATRRGFWVILALEAFLLLLVFPLALPPVLKGAAGGVVYLAAFWAIATLLYFSNYRVWRWLQRST